MTFQIDNSEIETAIIVGVHLRGSRPLLPMEQSLEELELLADTAGIDVVGRITQSLNQVDPGTFIGSGKVQEVIDAVHASAAKTVIFDDELSPRHQRELARQLGDNIKLLDRSALILDIFAQHARTREGALQVELAQYEYRLPRLTRQWTHLARQAGGGTARGGSGGVGLRGPGETQLEVDRREISRKIAKLKSDLENVRKHRQQHRTNRARTGIPVIALVGYTNAGKSTLLNQISRSDVLVADQLFATLDPTTRRIDLPSGRAALLTDTVGFIQKLPTALIAAFRATLEEIAEADLILHVVDMSHDSVVAHIEAVEDTLAEIDVPSVPRILVWNKLDRVGDPAIPQIPDADPYEAQIMVSARTGAGITELLEHIDRALASRFYQWRLLIPYNHGEVVAMMHERARVLDHESTAEGVLMTVELPVTLSGRVVEFKVD